MSAIFERERKARRHLFFGLPVGDCRCGDGPRHVVHNIALRLKPRNAAVRQRNRNLNQIGVEDDSVLRGREIHGENAVVFHVVALVHLRKIMLA